MPDFEKTLADLRKNFGKAVAPLQIPFDDENGNFIGFINLIKRDARKKVNGKLEKQKCRRIKRIRLRFCAPC